MGNNFDHLCHHCSLEKLCQIQINVYIFLTHFPLVPHICISELGQHWFRWWLVPCSTPSHHLNQCCLNVNGTLRNKLQWNFDKNTKLFIYGNVFENVVVESGGHFVQGRWVGKNLAYWALTAEHTYTLELHWYWLYQHKMAAIFQTTF